MHENNFADFPEKFVQIVSETYKDAGERWLSDLPRIVGDIAENWSLQVERHFPNLSYNFVAPCVCADGTKAVLKIGFCAEKSEIFDEARLLNNFDGKGAVKLLKFDENRCALLLERLIPGKNLLEICSPNDNARATRIAIDAMRKFWQTSPANHDYPMLENWFDGLSRTENTIFPQQFARKARTCFEELNSSSEQKFVLHGDLHHENILSATREPFLIIDPKGIIGDIGYETSVFLNNQAHWIWSQPNLEERLNTCVRQFSEAFEIPTQNLRKWAFAQKVLSAWWTFGDGGKDWREELKMAEIWEEF